MYHPSLCDSWGTNLYNPFNDTVNCHPLPTEVKNRSQSPGWIFYPDTRVVFIKRGNLRRDVLPTQGNFPCDLIPFFFKCKV